MKIGLFLITLVFSSVTVCAQDVVEKTITIDNLDTLTLDECVKIALVNQPALGASQGAIITAESEYTQVLSSRFPQIQLEAGAHLTNSPLQSGSVFGPDQTLETTKKWNFIPSVRMTVKQPIYDFGRTEKALDSKRKLIKASEMALESTEEDVILNVHTAYYNYVLAKQIVRINEDRVKQSNKHLERAKGFFSVGKIAESEVSKAELEVANSELQLIDAKGKARLAKVSLNSAMGITEIDDDPTDYLTTYDVTYEPFHANLKDAINSALESRKEVKVSELKIQAWRSALSAAKSQYFPIISASGGTAPYIIQTVNNDGLTTDKFKLGWNVGLNFAFPIFQGLTVRADIAESLGGIRSATSQSNVTKQRIVQDVQEKFFGAKVAEERYKASEKIIIQSEKNLKLAEGRFDTGVGSAIEVTDASFSLANAKIDRTTALYNYRIELSRFQRSTGTIKK
ncbi:TolC family protein [bacterium]|nr:TolC family protein [bacterium]